MARLWKAARYGLLAFALLTLVGADSPLQSAAFLSPEQANAQTVAALTRGNPPLVGWALRSETRVLGLTQVHDATGKVRYGTTQPENAYVLYYTAPAQHGCAYVYAIAVTADAGGGGWQVVCSDDPHDAYPGPGPNTSQVLRP